MGEFHDNLISASKQTLQIKRPVKPDKKTIVKKIYLSQNGDVDIGNAKMETVDVPYIPSSVSATRPHTEKF